MFVLKVSSICQMITIPKSDCMYIVHIHDGSDLAKRDLRILLQFCASSGYSMNLLVGKFTFIMGIINI